MPTAATVVIKIDADSAKLIKELQKAERRTKRFKGGVGKSLRDLSRSFLLFRGVAVAALSALAVKKVVDTGLAMQGLQRAFAAAAGSAEGGRREFAFVSAEAERLGLNLEDASQAFAKLSAASQGSKLAGEETRRVFTSVAEAARVLNLSADQTGGALRALEQIISKGKVQAEELRGQLGERLPGAFATAAKAMGVTTAELNKMLDTGRVTAEEFIPAFSRALQERFSKDVPAATQDARASFERLGNAMFKLKAAIAESGLLELLADIADKTVTFINISKEVAAGFGFGSEADKAAQQVKILEGGLVTARRNLQALADATEPNFVMKLFGAENVDEQRMEIVGRILDLERELIAARERVAAAAIPAAPSGGAGIEIPDTKAPDLAAEQEALTKLAIEQAQSEADAKLRIDQQLKAALLGNEQEQNTILLELARQLAEQKALAEIEATNAARAAAGLDPLGGDEIVDAEKRADGLVKVAQDLVKRMEAIDIKAKADAKERAEKEARQRAETERNLQNVFSTLAQAGSKKVAAVGKALSIVTTTRSTATGIMNAFRDLPYPAALAASASIAATGAAQLATIRGTTLGGGGSPSGAISAATPPISATPSEPAFGLGGEAGIPGASTQRAVQVIFQGDVIGWDEHIETRVIGAIQDAVVDRDVILIHSDSRNALDLAEVLA